MSYAKLLRIDGDDLSICLTFFFIVFLVTRNVVEHRHKILAEKISGVSPDLLSRSVTLLQSCNVVNPGKIFHSNSVGSPLILFF